MVNFVFIPVFVAVWAAGEPQAGRQRAEGEETQGGVSQNNW